MPITGGVKFFYKSLSLAADGTTILASSGQAAAPYALSMNRYVRWDSVGSNDATTETLTITFPQLTTFSRLFIVDTNIKDFNVFYDTNQNFTNVVSIDGDLPNIQITNNANNTAYYEFDDVTANNIQIEMFNTQIPNEDKYIVLVAVTNEIGTLEGFPNLIPQTDCNEKRSRTENGKFITQKSFEVFRVRLDLDYESQNDIDIINNVYEGLSPFLIWLCGGIYGNPKFSVEFKNWRLKDLYQVQTSDTIRTTFRKNIYSSSPQITLDMFEEI